VTPRLHIFLGPGGAGKTTLAAAYAGELARSGRRVGLLGIDPSRRLQGALGVTLPDLQVAVPSRPGLSAALLRPEDCLRRWAEEQCPDAGARERLKKNVFFVALADRLASASDLLAAVRVAEWIEHDAALDDLVVDTAPGLNALEFLRRPATLVAFMEGRVVRWLRWLASGQSGGALRGGAQRVVDALGRIGGTNLLFDLAEFLVLAEGVLEKMSQRLEAAERWFADARTEILLVAAVREDTPGTVQELARALGASKLAPSAIVLNRALPEALDHELAPIRLDGLDQEAASVVRFARGYVRMQARVGAALASLGPLVVVPAVTGLDADDRWSALETLGERLAAALARRADSSLRALAHGGADAIS
jgi:anion-transporting  ArsA/GET3 family ATPase